MDCKEISQNKNLIQIKIEVDSIEIDKTLEKAKEVLEKIPKLFSDIKELNKLTEVISRMSREDKKHWFKNNRKS